MEKTPEKTANMDSTDNQVFLEAVGQKHVVDLLPAEEKQSFIPHKAEDTANISLPQPAAEKDPILQLDEEEEQKKQLKRTQNLADWKWDEVMEISSDSEEDTADSHMPHIKRRRANRVSIFTRNKVIIVGDEEEDEA